MEKKCCGTSTCESVTDMWRAPHGIGQSKRVRRIAVRVIASASNHLDVLSFRPAEKASLKQTTFTQIKLEGGEK